MRRFTKSFCAIALCLALLALIPLQAFAAGPIETETNGSLTLHYVDGDIPIVNAEFDLFRVADVDAYANMTVTEAFAGYPINIQDLPDQDAWMALASTLKGYVLRDDLAPDDSGMTDETGTVCFPSEGTSLKPGLYLVIGYRATTDDFNTYYAVPFMVFLPSENLEENIWEYDLTADMIANVKFDKEINPPDEPGPEPVITRKVIKVWDDENFVSERPESITVRLLRDGEEFDVQELSEANNWRYSWDNLESGYEWLVVEDEMDAYYTTTELTNIIFTITNKFIAPIPTNEIEIYKSISGVTPESASDFSFVLSALDGAPLPGDAEGTELECTITGEGKFVFDPITFTKAGTYSYAVSEKIGDVSGYTYDTSIYTLTFDVVEENGDLSYTVSILKNGQAADAIVFVNNYTPPLIQTGLLWWPVPVMLCLGAVLLIVGFARRKVND